MKSLWVRWVLLAVFVAALATTFVNLGMWQLDRLDQRRDRNATVVAHESAPVVPYDQVFNRVITEQDQWQRVQVTGTFDATHQLLVRYRSNDQATGWEAVTPLRTREGTTVLVSRGFVPRTKGTDFPQAAPPPPSGTVTIVGHVRRNEQGKDTATVPNQGTIRLINSDRIGEWMGEDLLNGYIGLLTIDPPQSGEFIPVEHQDLTEGPHLSYAVQWFAFTAIAGFGLVVLIRNDVRDKKKAERRSAAGRE